MNIMEAVNYAYPDTITRLGLVAFNGSQPYGNVHVQVGAGKSLPAWSAVAGLVEDYELNALRQANISYLAQYRYEVETRGIPISGMSIATDDRSKMMLGNARLAAQANENFTASWKTQSGFVQLTAGQIIGISDAVAAHVNKCFLVEANILQNIGNYETTEAIKSAFDNGMAA